MNADLTLSTLTFKTLYSDKTGSLRQDVSRGVNLPSKLLIRSQDAIDSATKLPATRTSARLEYHEALTDGSIAPTITATLTVSAVKDAVVTSAHILTVVTLLEQLVTGATNTNGLDLKEEIFVNKEQ